MFPTGLQRRKLNSSTIFRLFGSGKPVQVVRRVDVDDLVIEQSRVVQFNRIESIHTTEKDYGSSTAIVL
jgi:hypothetical protein